MLPGLFPPRLSSALLDWPSPRNQLPRGQEMPPRLLQLALKKDFTESSFIDHNFTHFNGTIK